MIMNEAERKKNIINYRFYTAKPLFTGSNPVAASRIKSKG